MVRVINPYNFIPFGEDENHRRTTREKTYLNNNLLSGWINVELLTKTPLIIPDAAHPTYIKDGKVVVPHNMKEANRLHKEYDFMNRNGENGKEYYIPGSTLRGMIRSVYEAATNSCVPFLLVDEKKPISKRVPLYSALHKRGLLGFDKNNNQWILYSAKICETVEAKVETSTIHENDRNGRTKTICSLVRVDGGGFPNTGTNIREKDGSLRVIQYNIPVAKDKPYHVVYLEKNQEVHRWSVGDDEPYLLLNSVLCRDFVKGGQDNPNEKQFSDLKTALDQAKQGKVTLVPVYYFIVKRKSEGEEKELVYLSNSAAGRIGQKRKWVDIMAEHGPCDDTKNPKNGLCPACLMFGALGEKNGLKSRIRVTDAMPVGELQFEKKNIDILGEPRPSAFEFYMERPENASYWNFDFYSISEKDEEDSEKFHTNYYDLEKAMPRGRKMYWHGKPKELIQNQKLSPYLWSEMTSVSNAKFSFKIYFDRITEEQLNTLLWTITLGDNTENSKQQHKLGHAKPYGYGSVKMVVSGGRIREIQKKDDNIIVSQKELIVSDDYAPNLLNMNSKEVKSLLKMSDATATIDNEVAYPNAVVKNRSMIFQWFSENRRNADVLKILPNVLDDDITLSSGMSSDQRKGVAQGQKGKTNSVRYKKGDIMKGEIADYNQKGILAFVTLTDGNSAVVFYKNTYKGYIPYGEMELYFPRGANVELQCEGESKDRNGKTVYNWRIVN